MGTGPIHIYNLQCEGFEDNLIDCDHDPVQVAVCDHKDDVGILCGKFIIIVCSIGVFAVKVSKIL